MSEKLDLQDCKDHFRNFPAHTHAQCMIREIEELRMVNADLLAITRMAVIIHKHRNGDGDMGPYLDAQHKLIQALPPHIKSEIEK